MTLRPLRVLQGLLLYLPHTVIGVPIPHAGLYVLGIMSVLLYNPTIRKEDWLYFLFALGVVLNAVLGIVAVGQFADSIFVNNGIIGGVLLVLTYLTARSLNDTVWRTVLFMIMVEAFTIYLQFALGIRFFFSAQQDLSTITSYEYTREVGAEFLWYYVRPQGLSESSTIAGSKMLLGVLIAYMLSMSHRVRWLIIAFLLGALLMNFKRSGILAIGLFAGILFLVDVLGNGWRTRHTIVASIIGVIAAYALGTIIVQFTRDKALSLNDLSIGVILAQLSGRAEIWQEASRFISHNLWFGNFSERYTISTGQYVHSSALSILATHGLFLAVLLTAFYAVKLWKRPTTLIILGPLLFDALFQEHIFWYASIFDIFLLYLLTTREPSPHWLTPWPRGRVFKAQERLRAARTQASAPAPATA